MESINKPPKETTKHSDMRNYQIMVGRKDKSWIIRTTGAIIFKFEKKKNTSTHIERQRKQTIEKVHKKAKIILFSHRVTTPDDTFSMCDS